MKHFVNSESDQNVLLHRTQELSNKLPEAVLQEGEHCNDAAFGHNSGIGRGSLIITNDQLEALGKKYCQENKRLVLTNGCFDLLHLGHVRYLIQARALGDALLVAVNSDRSVQELKGPTRPLNSEQERAEVLAALRCVDYVTIFEELRVTEVIKKLRPALYAKGGDYTPETLDLGERNALEECGAEVKILPLVPGRSTTRLMGLLTE